jgi:pimeloyl-ACP methyl ester carboxylesterase
MAPREQQHIDQRIRLPDARMLGYRVYGDPNGAPLLFLHGTPGSRVEFSIGHETCKALRLAIVAPDRWGYGLTDAPAEPSLAAFAADMAALMDHLGYARFAAGGISGGAPYAAAVAACLGVRVTALALVSPLGPIADAAVRARLRPLQRLSLTVLPAVPWVVAGVFKIFRLSLVRAPQLAGRLATLRAPAKDKGLIARPEIAEPLLASFREGLRPGMAGPVIDLALFSRPWDIAVSAIVAPARLWIGDADTVAPLPAARALAAQIGGCTLTELPQEGHLWVAANYPDVLEWIAGVRQCSA